MYCGVFTDAFRMRDFLEEIEDKGKKIKEINNRRFLLGARSY